MPTESAIALPPGCVEACPACRYRSFAPHESDRRKQEWCAKNFAPWQNSLRALRSPSQRWNYRRKICLHAERRREGWALGLLKRRGRETELIELRDCPLHASAINSFLAALGPQLPKDLPLAFVLVTGSLVTLVLKCKPQHDWRAWARALEPLLRSTGVEGLQINWHPSAGRRVLSSRHQERVFGEELLHDGQFFYGAQSFRQQIPELESAALRTAQEFLAGANAKLAVDLYSGGGSTLALWAKQGWRAVGVELVGEACTAAQKNAPQATVLRGKVEDRLAQLSAFVGGETFVAFTNPPRNGHSAAVLEWLAQARPERIAYLSCNARTLGRDLQFLSPRYSVDAIQPFDFFPQTDHVEALALLENRR